MRWKASSHSEAAKVLANIAKSGIVVLNQLDVHAEIHSASNDSSIKTEPGSEIPAELLSLVKNIRHSETVAE